MTLKYKTDNFDVKTRVTQLMEPTLDGAMIAKAAIRLLSSERAGLTLRLLGVRMSQLTSSMSSVSSSSRVGGSNSIGRKQRTLNELLLSVECPATKKRKLDEASASGSQPNSSSSSISACCSYETSASDELKGKETSSLLFTCPVCHSWQTADGEVSLNRHIDECLNQQVLHSLHPHLAAVPIPTALPSSSSSCLSSSSLTCPFTMTARKEGGKGGQTKLDRFIIKKS